MTCSLPVIALTISLCLLSACLVPIPLDQQNPTDGGQLLVVTSAIPEFGARSAIKQTDGFVYSIHVQSDSSNLAGRLYLQVNESCCDLMVDDPNATRFLESAANVTADDPSGNSYTVGFGTVVPCVQVASGAVAYVVPVLASGGFADGPNGIRPEGLGTVDQTHFWSVRCP